MLIKRIYEIDPMVCSKCGGQMKVISFNEPPLREVVEKILRGHRRAADGNRRSALVGFASVPVGGLWQASEPRAPPDVDGLVHELDYVDIDTFLATFQGPARVEFGDGLLTGRFNA